MVPTTIIGIVVGKGTVRGFEQVKTIAATIIGDVVIYNQPFALITE
jgi:hypothetical protein